MDLADRGSLHGGLIYRSFDLDEVEVRDATDGAGWTFEGVASVVDVPYTVRDVLGEFTETIRAGAFDKTIAEVQRRAGKAKKPGDDRDVALYINHQRNAIPLASTYGGTLTLTADPNLRATASLDPERPDAITARSAISRKELRQMSIGFNVPKDKRKDEWNADFTERVIHEVMLDEVSIVRYGANPHTAASVRSFDEWLESLTDIDMDETDIRRAIAMFEARLTPAGPVVVPNFAERDRAERDRLDRLYLDALTVT